MLAAGWLASRCGRWNGAPLTEGPFFDGQSQRPLLDHVYTYFDNGLAQAVLTPYVVSVVTE